MNPLMSVVRVITTRGSEVSRRLTVGAFIDLWCFAKGLPPDMLPPDMALDGVCSSRGLVPACFCAGGAGSQAC